MSLTVRIIVNDKITTPGRLADAELHFDGYLEGLKLIGFTIWERRDGGRNVTFPARQYSVNGERRTFALLRPVCDVSRQEAVRDLILRAYADCIDRADKQDRATGNDDVSTRGKADRPAVRRTVARQHGTSDRRPV
jgi:hypothetical protein